jgi:hypothetical protein
MDGDTFDRIARQLTTAANRRTLLSGLGGVAWLAAFLIPGEDATAKRRKRKMKKSKDSCSSDARSQTCQGRCGSVVNNGSPAVQCDDNCPTCSRCGGQGTCVRNVPGTQCAADNTWTADGQSECDSSLCGTGKV